MVCYTPFPSSSSSSSSYLRFSYVSTIALPDFYPFSLPSFATDCFATAAAATSTVVFFDFIRFSAAICIWYTQVAAQLRLSLHLKIASARAHFFVRIAAHRWTNTDAAIIKNHSNHNQHHPHYHQHHQQSLVSSSAESSPTSSFVISTWGRESVYVQRPVCSEDNAVMKWKLLVSLMYGWTPRSHMHQNGAFISHAVVQKHLCMVCLSWLGQGRCRVLIHNTN